MVRHDTGSCYRSLLVHICADRALFRRDAFRMSFFLTVVVLFPPKVGSLFDKYTLDNLFMICYTGIYAAPVFHCLLLCVDKLDVGDTLISKVLTGAVFSEGIQYNVFV